ncbi:MAG: hypothetical protein HYV60_09265 [Planctomycetia bacterium]|nr:hypothetical protein [Planctomycetia bacterium]
MKTPVATTSTRYREISVAGTPREMGRQIGEAARDEVRGFCEVVFGHVLDAVPISRERAMKIAIACIPFVENYSPDMLDRTCSKSCEARQRRRG